ncbi:hypothetical protein [Sagittula sp. S175]|uniref:hypothetical protein n=1 Tax=Sagittula sp. S175 TaxID=3415129 RepID=UPI003C7AE550
MTRSVVAVLFFVLSPIWVAAQTISFEPRGGLVPAGQPLIGGGARAIIGTKNEGQARVLQVSLDPSGADASLFAGRAAASFFAPYPAREGRRVALLPMRSGDGGPVAQLRDLIASAEAGKMQYDAVQYGARIKPSKPPTQMTIAEIYQWIDDTPGQPHAIGRYQIIPKTLRGLVRKAGLDVNTRYSPQVQDQLADILLEEAGLTAMREGVMTRTAFMNNIAKIWAGLPNSSGRSHYHGYAGNAASMSWAHFEAQMARIFPA